MLAEANKRPGEPGLLRLLTNFFYRQGDCTDGALRRLTHWYLKLRGAHSAQFPFNQLCQQLERSDQPYTLRNTKEPLVPPKPKELHRVYSKSVTWRAAPGTKSKSQPSSGLSRLMVAGIA